MEPGTACTAGLTKVTLDPDVAEKLPGTPAGWHNGAIYLRSDVKQNFDFTMTEFNPFGKFTSILKLGDMSLHWGGAIDQFGEWLGSGHFGHREGCAIDILLVNDSGVDQVTVSEYYRLLEKLHGNAFLVRTENFGVGGRLVLHAYDRLGNSEEDQ